MSPKRGQPALQCKKALLSVSMVYFKVTMRCTAEENKVFEYGIKRIIVGFSESSDRIP